MPCITTNPFGAESFSGSSGNITFVNTDKGTVARKRSKPKNPKTPAQEAARARLKQVQVAYAALTMPQVLAWRAYATGLTVENKRTGVKYTPTSNNVYVALATKFLQVTPAGSIPANPPAYPFSGDGITVSVTGGGSKLTFTASAKNTAGITTEFLLQKLKNKAILPSKTGYRSKGFYAFNTPLTYDLAPSAGWYSVAYRFVNVATGQESTPIVLGVFQVV